MLRAIQDANKVIWVGVKWVCEGIGFSEDKTDNERKKLSKDIVLSSGVKFHSIPTSGGVKDVLCLQLDYLPLWLAKIAITPTMQRDNPELVDKLIAYQLTAKDVLAKAFLPQYQQERDSSSDYDSFAKQAEIFANAISQIVDVMAAQQKQMGQLIDVHLANIQPTNTNSTASSQYTNVSDDREQASWKTEVNALMDSIVKNNPRMFPNGKRNGVYARVYNAMRMEDGVDWKKLASDFKEQHNLLYTPSTITVCYSDENLRNNFMDRLREMAEEGEAEAQKQTASQSARNVSTQNLDIFTREQLDEVIQPLVNSLGGEKCKTAAKRRVYTQMERTYGVSWRMREIRFTNANGFAPKNKAQMIQRNKSLMSKYKKAVRDLLETEKERTDEK